MPALVQLLTNDAVNRYTPPEGYVVLFVQQVGSYVTLKCKKSDGTIVDVGVGNSNTPAYIDNEETTLVVTDAHVDPQEATTLTVPNGELNNGILTIL